MPKLPSKKQVIVAYIPVLHRGYIQLFAAFPDASKLYLVDKKIVPEIDYLRKDLRALEPAKTKQLIAGLNSFDTITQLTSLHLRALNTSETTIVMPDDDISHLLAKKLKKATVTFYPVFLRWDRRSLENIDESDSVKSIKANEFQRSIMSEALKTASQSSDLWRRVGAVLVLPNGQKQMATNQGESTPYSPWMEGDPRNIFNRGVAIEMSVFLHAEANLIAEAAKRGQSLLGASLYVSTFPCPACAKLIAHSGIQKLYYGSGYSILDGRRVMEDYGAEVIRIDTDDQKEAPEVWVPYPKK